MYTKRYHSHSKQGQAAKVVTRNIAGMRIVIREA